LRHVFLCGEPDKGKVCILTEFDNKSNQYTDLYCKKWQHSGSVTEHGSLVALHQGNPARVGSVFYEWAPRSVICLKNWQKMAEGRL